MAKHEQDLRRYIVQIGGIVLVAALLLNYATEKNPYPTRPSSESHEPAPKPVKIDNRSAAKPLPPPADEFTPVQHQVLNDLQSAMRVRARLEGVAHADRTCTRKATGSVVCHQHVRASADRGCSLIVEVSQDGQKVKLMTAVGTVGDEADMSLAVGKCAAVTIGSAMPELTTEKLIALARRAMLADGRSVRSGRWQVSISANSLMATISVEK